MYQVRASALRSFLGSVGGFLNSNRRTSPVRLSMPSNMLRTNSPLFSLRPSILTVFFVFMAPPSSPHFSICPGGQHQDSHKEEK
jgi:hypothetical protein